MKKLVFLFLLISSFSYAQFSINGTMTKAIETDWLILYKIESTKQVFVANTTIKKGSLLIDGKEVAIGTFTFNLPKNAKSGAYRATYKLKGAGFIDFIFNKENISFAFNPDYPEDIVQFSDSKENIIYRQYLEKIALKQQKLDSIQVAILKNKTLNLDAKYKKAYTAVIKTQNSFLARTKGLYVQPFVKASLRKNSSEIIKTPQKYMSNLIATFFDNINFSDRTLINSSFLTNRITDYIFYINYSDDKTEQNVLFKESIDTILSKIPDVIYKKEIIIFLISQFEESRNLEIIDYLLGNYYKKLPNGVQNKKFLAEKNQLFAAEIGRIAPNFSWTEKNKKIQLSNLKSAENYILVFWSTECSHCLREIPQLYGSLKDNKKIKVIAFSMEHNDLNWERMKKDLPNWHHAIGLGKWENKTARTYNINSTPSYFVLDKNKKIIAKPKELKDIKAFIEKL